MDEQWKAWPFDERMEASTLGRVRRDGRIMATYAHKPFVPGRSDTDMYLRVQWSVKGRKFKAKVHRIVCDAWLGPLPKGMHRAHVNGNLLDNRLENLAIVEPRVNMVEHRIAQGLEPIHRSSEDDIRRAFALYSAGWTMKDIDQEMGWKPHSFDYFVERRTAATTDEQWRDGREQMHAGESADSVARRMGVRRIALTNGTDRKLRDSTRIDEARRASIRAALHEGVRQVDIAMRFGVCVATVSRINTSPP